MQVTGGELFDRILAKDHYSETEAARCFLQVRPLPWPDPSTSALLSRLGTRWVRRMGDAKPFT